MPMAYTITSVSRISCFTADRLVSLFVSLPSEINTMAFLRFWPVCAIGTASASASYIAVPPPAVMRPTTRLRRLRSVVQSCSSSGKLLKR